MKRYSAVVFDLDGTLLNTLYDLTEGVNHTMSGMNCPPHTVAEVKSFVGNGILKLIERSLPEKMRTEKNISAAYEIFTAFYGKHCADRTVPYAGIPEMLTVLRQEGIPMSVVSNKDEGASRVLCKRFFGDIFDTVIGGRRDLPRKPAPDGVGEALKAMGADKRRTLYVGDSDVDIATARNAGMDCVSVTWGFRERDMLEKLSPDYMADNAKELLNVILQNE